MDPKEALRLLLKYIKQGDVEEAKEMAEILAEWCRKGGFFPEL